MSGWLVLFGIVGMVVLFVLLPVATATFTRYRGPRRLRCPLAGTDATVEVDAVGAALSEVVGRPGLTAEACSRWPWARGCRQQCLNQDRLEPTDARPVSTATPRTILVPLDGTPDSEAVLPKVEAMAHEQAARIRLVRVSAYPPPVLDAERIIVYAHQEDDRVEHDGLAYLKVVAGRLPGLDVDRVVRLGEPVSEIVAEAESSGADLIAMATHDRTGVARLRWGSITDAVAHSTRIPVIRVHSVAEVPTPG